jgi:Fe-S-cluster containining protein
MTCIHEYHQLLAALDAEIVHIAKMHAGAISCGPGCASCCRPFSVLAIEAACVREAVATLDTASREQLDRNLAEGDACCPLLIDDLCAIYAARPVICRTQGLPLAYVDEEREAIEVSACGLNFPDDHGFAPEDLLFMDQFNTRLAELNRTWCRKRNLDPTKRIPLRELACPTPLGA